MAKNDFNFDRCLKFVFSCGNIGKDNTFVVEYNPRKAPYLCPHLEAEIVDTPAIVLNKKPGFTAVLKIYNPSENILSMIASGMSYFTNGGTTHEYYAAKVRVAVYAGYFAPKEGTTATEEKKKEKDKKDALGKASDKTNITLLKDDELLGDDAVTYGGKALFTGFVNNSMYEHKSTDNILTLTCHSIDITAMQYKQMKPIGNTKKFVPVFSWDVAKNEPQKGFPTFDQTFKYFASKYADSWYPPAKRGVLAETTPEALEINSPERGTTNPQWLKVFYVNSRTEFESLLNTGGSWEDVKQNEELWRRATDANLENRIRTDKFYTNAGDKESCLNDLCAFGGERLSWKCYTNYWGYIVYAVWPIGSYRSQAPITSGEVVKIINFQNLLDTPTVDGAGSLNVKMWFNKECNCERFLALVLDSTYQGNSEESGILNINKLNFTKNPFSDNQLIVPLGGSSSNPAVSTTQLSTSMAISAAAHYQEVAAKNGYMFNVGFRMVKVVHKLSTHGKEWATTVKTVPLMTGVKE